MFLCIHDLIELTGGQLRAAAMPSLAGAWVHVPRIVLEPSLVEPGDLFWCLDDAGCDSELAYLRGAIGVVAATSHGEPWPGTFRLLVEDAVAALDRLVEALLAGEIQIAPTRFSAAQCEAPALAAAANVAHFSGEQAFPEESGEDESELKVLQLYEHGGVDIYPPTCGQSAKGHWARRCRQRAA